MTIPCYLTSREIYQTEGSLFKRYSNSAYYQAGLSFRYKFNRRIDLEFGSTIGINNEDNLDAAYTNIKTNDFFIIPN